MSLTSNARVAQVFQATASVFHSLHAFMTLQMDWLWQGLQPFNQYQYAIVLTHVIACMLQTFLNVAACQFFIQVISDTPLLLLSRGT